MVTKETIARIRANVSESTDLAVTTIERLTSVCETTLDHLESGAIASANVRHQLYLKLREALGKPK